MSKPDFSNFGRHITLIVPSIINMMCITFLVLEYMKNPVRDSLYAIFGVMIIASFFYIIILRTFSKEERLIGKSTS